MEWAGRRLDGRGVADAATAVIVALIIRYAIVDPPGPSSWWPAWSAWPAAIRVVAAGEALLAPTVTRRLIAEFLRRPHPAPAVRDLGDITQRGREVL